MGLYTKWIFEDDFEGYEYDDILIDILLNITKLTLSKIKNNHPFFLLIIVYKILVCSTSKTFLPLSFQN